MSVVTLEEAKEHLEVIDDDQDAKIQRYIDAAERFVEQYLDRSLVPWCDDEEECSESSEASSESAVPADVRHAILLVVGDFLILREASLTGTIYAKNPAMEYLLHFHRKGLGI